MVEAEDLGQEGPERHQRTEDAVTEADLVFVQDLVDGGRVEQVVKRELGRVAELIDFWVIQRHVLWGMAGLRVDKPGRKFSPMYYDTEALFVYLRTDS